MIADALLCDADGNLFPSEEPAFEASADVTNAFLESLGVGRRYSPEELRLATTGQTFRKTALELAEVHAVAAAVDPVALELWVAEERRRVTEHLGRVLSPDPEVRGPLRDLAPRWRLAAVSSSASVRLEASFEATGLDVLFPEPLRFSAEDSLPVPTSKPDPAIYTHALAQLGVAADDAIAVEDAVPGVRSAVGAGIPTVGNLVFVPPAERQARAEALRAAGATAVVESWRELQGLLEAAAVSEPIGMPAS
jgi:beta-phosphoglucomutase-like phosphatase (HAD superfamily)